jgi:hypothetical protein
MPATFAHQTLQTGAQTKDVTSSFLRRKVARNIAGSTRLSDGDIVVDQVGPDAPNNVE